MRKRILVVSAIVALFLMIGMAVFVRVHNQSYLTELQKTEALYADPKLNESYLNGVIAMNEAVLTTWFWQRQKRDALQETAITHFTTFLDREPDDFQVRNMRAVLYTERQQYGEALADFNYILSSQGEGSLVLASRAEIYAQMRDCAKAFDDYQRALDLLPLTDLNAKVRLSLEGEVERFRGCAETSR